MKTVPYYSVYDITAQVGNIDLFERMFVRAAGRSMRHEQENHTQGLQGGEEIMVKYVIAPTVYDNELEGPAIYFVDHLVSSDEEIVSDKNENAMRTLNAARCLYTIPVNETNFMESIIDADSCTVIGSIASSGWMESEEIPASNAVLIFWRTESSLYVAVYADNHNLTVQGGRLVILSDEVLNPVMVNTQLVHVSLTLVSLYKDNRDQLNMKAPSPKQLSLDQMFLDVKDMSTNKQTWQRYLLLSALDVLDDLDDEFTSILYKQMQAAHLFPNFTLTDIDIALETVTNVPFNALVYDSEDTVSFLEDLLEESTNDNLPMTEDEETAIEEIVEAIEDNDETNDTLTIGMIVTYSTDDPTSIDQAFVNATGIEETQGMYAVTAESMTVDQARAVLLSDIGAAWYALKDMLGETFDNNVVMVNIDAAFEEHSASILPTTYGNVYLGSVPFIMILFGYPYLKYLMTRHAQPLYSVDEELIDEEVIRIMVDFVHTLVVEKPKLVANGN